MEVYYYWQQQSNGISSKFAVYAADNSDLLTTCINSCSLSHIQNNDCIVNSGCGNFANADSNTQNNNCRTSNCVNVDLSHQGSNIQTNNCVGNSSCTNEHLLIQILKLPLAEAIVFVSV